MAEEIDKTEKIDKIDKFEDELAKLIDTGKEKGYLTFGEVNDLLPGDITSPDELDDLMTTINTQGIDVLTGRRRAKSPTTWSSTCRRGRWRRPTIRCACTCAKWARYRC